MSRSNFDGLYHVGCYLLLGLFVGTICNISLAAPLRISLPVQHSEQRTIKAPVQKAPQLEDLAGRNERSPSHVTGTARKIQMFIKNRHLQILPDGVVNGTTDDTSIFTILQRTTVGIGQVKIQGVATCHYLCMASCGLLYSSKEFGDDCVFKETIEQSNYNSYCSKKYSTDKRTVYLALNRKGLSRKVVIRLGSQLGKLASYARVLTRNVPDLQLQSMSHQPLTCIQPATDNIPKSKHYQHCPKKKKRKKKNRPCLDDPKLCQNRTEHRPNSTKCDANKKDNMLCLKDIKVKQINKNSISDVNLERKIKKGVMKKYPFDEVPTTLVPTTLALENIDDDYGFDPATDWESTTVSLATTEVPRITALL